jgi:tRNA-specific 2-thiouridylase
MRISQPESHNQKWETSGLVVGFKSDLYAEGCHVTDINWISNAPQGPIQAKTRIRYRHGGAFSTVTPIGKKEAHVRFDEPQMAVTPGQGAVFYDGDRVLGSGWIDRG